MLPIALFGIILVVAAISVAFYYWSESRPLAPRRKESPVGRKTSKQPEERPDTPRPSPRKTEAASIPGHEISPEEPELKKEAIGSREPGKPEVSLKSYFVDADLGIFHQADRLSERGWSDLEYTLVSLSRLPTDVAELLNVLNDPDSSAGSVGAVCERNVGLTARILKLVNSPFYGLRSPVDDIQQAVALLGFEEIRQIVLTTSIFSSGNETSGPLSIEELWKHSLAVARITSWIADRSKVRIRKGLAGTSAMLHDVGKVVLQSWRPQGFREVIEIAGRNHTALMTEERDELGVTHALAGILLLHNWHLPVSLSWIVRGCHLPVVNADMPESAVVHLAGNIARYMAMGSDGEPAEEFIQQDIRDLLGIKAETVSELVSEGFEEYVEGVLSDIRATITN